MGEDAKPIPIVWGENMIASKLYFYRRFRHDHVTPTSIMTIHRGEELIPPCEGSLPNGAPEPEPDVRGLPVHLWRD